MAQNNTTNTINLDKTCAEFGMNLLEFPKKLYEKANMIIKNSSNLNDFKIKNYSWTEEESKCQNFYSFNLIDPLKAAQGKIKNDNDFNKLKKKDEPLNFDPKIFETEITKALGILVEDGPFAYMIWLKSQDKEPHRAMLIQTARILRELGLIKEINSSQDLKKEDKFLSEISSNLTKTLFAKTILEKMLTYARYKAKAMQHE